MTLWSFNGKSSSWGVGNSFALEAEGLSPVDVPIESPLAWISAVTFLSGDNSVQPDTVVLHVANEAEQELELTSLRLWLPQDRGSWQKLWPQKTLAVATVVPPNDKGFIKLQVAKLPLTYAAIELQTNKGPLWAHLRIKPRDVRHQRWLGGRPFDAYVLFEVARPHAREYGSHRERTGLHR